MVHTAQSYKSHATSEPLFSTTPEACIAQGKSKGVEQGIKQERDRANAIIAACGDRHGIAFATIMNGGSVEDAKFALKHSPPLAPAKTAEELRVAKAERDVTTMINLATRVHGSSVITPPIVAGFRRIAGAPEATAGHPGIPAFGGGSTSYGARAQAEREYEEGKGNDYASREQFINARVLELEGKLSAAGMEGAKRTVVKINETTMAGAKNVTPIRTAKG